MIVVYTCILDAWDYLRPPQIVGDARYVCYTNRHMDPVPPWELQPAYAPFERGSRNSRLPKILPHLHFDAEYSLYHDANFVLREKPEDLLRYLRHHDIAMFDHPCRTHLGQEAAALRELHAKGELPGLVHADLDAQETRWKHRGAPLGLWAGGMILRRHTRDVAIFNEVWWEEFAAGCTRDQIALPIAKHITGIDINTIRGDIYQCAMLALHWHSAWRGKYTNAQYETRQGELDAKWKRLKEICR